MLVLVLRNHAAQNVANHFRLHRFLRITAHALPYGQILFVCAYENGEVFQILV